MAENLIEVIQKRKMGKKKVRKREATVWVAIQKQQQELITIKKNMTSTLKLKREQEREYIYMYIYVCILERESMYMCSWTIRGGGSIIQALRAGYACVRNIKS